MDPGTQLAPHLVDTHCHIHEIVAEGNTEDGVHQRWAKAGFSDADRVISAAADDGVGELICVGTDVGDSELAVGFVQPRDNAWASIGIHPHEAKRYIDHEKMLKRFASLAGKPKVVAVGECGLDYFYTHSKHADQLQILRFQMELAQEYGLPMIFHVREAFQDFWPIFDEYDAQHKIQGVVHSFTADRATLDEALARGLYIGLNGIMTFTKDEEQLAAAKAVPAERLLLETDAPFLTPAPHRGTMCEPKHVRVTLEFLAALRDEDAHQLAAITTTNARHLFALHG